MCIVVGYTLVPPDDPELDALRGSARDDADVRRADAMTSLDHADGQMMIAGTEQMKNLAATDAHKSPRHISKLAGWTPVEQRSSDRKSEPDAETGPKHAQQVDDAPIINHARKPSESGGCRNGLSPAGGSDGRRADDDWWQEWQNYWFAEGILNAILENGGMWKSDYDRIRGRLDAWRRDLERRRRGDAP